MERCVWFEKVCQIVTTKNTEDTEKGNTVSVCSVPSVVQRMMDRSRGID
jgi:hypothetical protein